MIKLKMAVLMLLMAFTQTLLSQTTVTGTVSDQEGVPLPGATVVVEGTSNGTTTDFDGQYELDNVATEDRLTFSYIGMSPQTVNVGTQSEINISLAEDTQALDEVVVVGYGQQSRADVTGAISTVDSEDITATPVTNAEQALQGRAAGVTITNSSSPGSSPNVRIRGLGTVGNNEPLYVIDGVITGGLSGINPSDIESVSVLKDASTTAIYGSQGSNGVIVVTTKKGTKQKGELSFNTYTGYQTNTKRYDVLNTSQYLQYANALGVIPARDPNIFNNNTDWQDQIYTSGVIQDHNLSYSGGGESSNYRFSMGYLSQDGAVINTGFDRYSFRANSSFSFGKLTVGETMAVTFSKQDPLLDSGGRTLLEHAIKSAPYLPVYNPNNLGGFQGPTSSLDGQDAENPVRVQTLGEAINKTASIIGSIYGEYEIVDGLKFKTQVGLDYFNFNNNRFVPSYNDDSEGGSTHSQAFASIVKNSGDGQTLLFTNSLNYTKTFADVHNVEFLLLSEKYENTFNSTNASSRNSISDEVNQLSDEQSALSSQTIEYNRIGYLARLNYNYDGKYIFAGSIRRDASSRFGANNKWGWFPSVALGYNIAKESFMENTAFSTLKLRGSYGLVGNDNIGNYQFSPTLNTNFLYPIGGIAAVGTTANGLANPDLKWEETSITNIGFDLGLFQEKFTASVEYFNNTSDDLLLSRPTPTSLGFNTGSVTENVGSVETKGFEVNLGYNDFEGDFTWSANLNFSTATNEVKSLGLVEEITGGGFEGANISRIIVGEPLFYFFGLVSDGIYQSQAEVDAVFTADPGQTTVQPGDVRFLDLNNDGTITSDDRTNIGNPFPDVTFGLNLNADYKNFDVNLFVNGVAGNDIYNTNVYDLQGQTRLFNSGVAVLDRWTPTNPSTTVPRALGAPQNVAISDYFVEDGSYVRLKNVTLGYTLPNDFLKDYFSKFRIYISGQKLITIT
ncbi:hypothetical protein LCGC14_0926040, partial [marine sediment metagenome]